jgi:hypothetical protein
MSEPRRTGDRDESAQHAGTAATESPLRSAPGERTEMGTADDSRRHPPHVTENADDAAIQNGEPDGEIPVIPPNASGHDRVPADDQARPIDPESAYDRRPAEDKDTPPGR